MFEEEAEVVEEGAGLELHLEMVIWVWSMMMVVMIEVATMVVGEGVEVEAVDISADVEGAVVTIAHSLITNRMVATTTRLLLRAEAAVVEGDLGGEGVDSNQMGRSMRQLEVLSWSKTGKHYSNYDVLRVPAQFLYVILFFSQIVASINF